jgi:hypothetical protein
LQEGRKTASIHASSGAIWRIPDQNLFTLIVTMAVITTTAMPTMLRWALKRLPLRKKERQRLEREELDAKGFVTNLERLLLAADDSANGKFAARLVGAIAGSGGKPTTVLDMNNGHRDKKPAKPKNERSSEKFAAKIAAAKPDGGESEQQVKTAVEGVTTLEVHVDEEKPGNVDVITRQAETNNSETIADEARKGYDLLVIGIAKTRNPNGGFSKDVSLITKGFEGPLAVIDSHQSNSDRSTERPGRILIPVNGSECRAAPSRSGSRWRERTTRRSPHSMSPATPTAATVRTHRGAA